MMQLSGLWKSLIRSSPAPVRCRPRATSLAPWLAAEVLEHRTLLSTPAHDVNLTVVNGDITLTSADAASHDITIRRSGGNVLFEGGADGTVITLGTSTLTTQSLAIASVGKISITTNTGTDIYTIKELSTTGTIALQGAASGTARLTVEAINTDVTIGGDIQANFGNETATLIVTSLVNKTISVNGAVTVKEAGTGKKVTNLGGTTGTVHLKSAVTITDSGTGDDDFRTFGTVVIDGNVTFSNAKNQTGKDTITIEDQSDGVVPVLNGALKLSLGGGTNSVTLRSAFDDAPAVVKGPVTITSGNGHTQITGTRVVFQNKFTGKIGKNSAAGSSMSFNSAEFDAVVLVTMTGTNSNFEVSTNNTFAVDSLFKSAVTLKMTGPTSAVALSHATPAGTHVTFESTLSITGGNPAGTLLEEGNISIGAGQLKLKKYNLVVV